MLDSKFDAIYDLRLNGNHKDFNNTLAKMTRAQRYEFIQEVKRRVNAITAYQIAMRVVSGDIFEK